VLFRSKSKKGRDYLADSHIKRSTPAVLLSDAVLRSCDWNR
jgi:hypothetical protein